jgi:Protein of unknown function (DUF3040)
MGLSAWEQQALDSIKNGLAGSDPDLAALLSEFNRLASGEEMPEREKIRAGSRRARPRLRRAARWLSRFQLAVLVLSLLTTAAVIAVALVLNAGGNGNYGPCTETVAMVCAGPAAGHSPGSPSYNATTGQSPGIPQAGP